MARAIEHEIKNCSEKGSFQSDNSGSNKHTDAIPFSGKWQKLEGVGTTFDSVVTRLFGRCRGERDSLALKWNRKPIGSAEEVTRTAMFLRRSVHLYRATLGEEFIVGTQTVVGAKRDGHKLKYKVYIVQPYVDGWNGKTLPETLRSNEYLVEQWRVLYARLFHLYNVARAVNLRVPPDGSFLPFPITLTVGASRQRALGGQQCEELIPRTPNLLIARRDMRISLCDFGAYTTWQEGMKPTYRQILESTQQNHYRDNFILVA
ncbi:hypothetical protein HYZ06_01910 [Candidatus Daviesbacteria bacterium]|nr:hypothetical protein [Candidatus Daviesbacteria bacterium]